MVTFVEFWVVVNPVCDTEVARVTLPLNPFRLVTLTVEVAEDPG